MLCCYPLVLCRRSLRRHPMSDWSLLAYVCLFYPVSTPIRPPHYGQLSHLLRSSNRKQPNCDFLFSAYTCQEQLTILLSSRLLTIGRLFIKRSVVCLCEHTTLLHCYSCMYYGFKLHNRFKL